MKRLFFALAAAVLLGACDSSTKYTITGNAADFEDGRSVYLVTAVNDELFIEKIGHRSKNRFFRILADSISIFKIFYRFTSDFRKYRPILPIFNR